MIGNQSIGAMSATPLLVLQIRIGLNFCHVPLVNMNAGTCLASKAMMVHMYLRPDL